ncbi:hypothetical protein [Marivita sp. GX14005]|uniref:hypothetical protein n=1 Tax=Marivita sp. GX14005 TaxID=2942276 RepID=UPI002018AE50|nr:hypothetical protein [Marivita sp. GX14005]MCL3880747.1 hypothetical protein [Marivita sp. GX14005]
MSAPKTNIEKQEKRHRPALWGMGILVVLVALGYFFYVTFLAAEGNEPGDEAENVVEPGVTVAE